MEEIGNIKTWLSSPTGAVRRNGEPQLNRHLLTISEIEVRAGMAERSLTKWLNGHQSFPITHLHNLIDVLEVHGYRALTNDHTLL